MLFLKDLDKTFPAVKITFRKMIFTNWKGLEMSTFHLFCAYNYGHIREVAASENAHILGTAVEDP